jgi:hypothetical protein
MKQLLQIFFVAGGVAFSAAAADADRKPVPPKTFPASPVALFRMLLMTNAAGREQWLAQKSPQQRDYIAAKIQEFETLAPAERENRLQTLQLRWVMPLLMKMTLVERTERLATLPAEERALIEKQFPRTWDILPPPVRQDVLENQMALGYFIPGSGSSNVWTAMTAAQREELQRQFENLDKMPPVRRNQAMERFKQFVERPSAEKDKALDRLTASERTQMEQTLTKFDNLPAGQREQALAGFRKFAELSPADRAAFLKSAQQWQKMSAADRERWRKIVVTLQAAKIIKPPSPVRSAALQPTASLVATNQ